MDKNQNNNWIKAVGIFVIAFIGGIFYRMGGSGNFPRWIREAGQGLCCVLVMILLGLASMALRPILGLVLAFGVCWVESTYFKKKGTDAKWWNWMLVGLVFGLIALPYCLLTNKLWLGFGIRTMVCMILTPFWACRLGDKVAKWFPCFKDPSVVGEWGRGFINVATLPLLLI